MSEPTIFSDTFLAMGAHCDVVLPNMQAENAKEIFQLIKTEVEKLEQSISRFNPVSSIWELNAAPQNEWVSVPDTIWDLLTIAYDFYQMSNGAFDITAGPLYTLHINCEEPLKENIDETLIKSGFNQVKIDFEKQQIQFTQDGMEFDFSAIEKGYALDLLKPMLIEKGIKDCIVSFEEDVVLAMGTHPAGEYWPIGVRNQQNPNEFLHVFPVENQSVVSNGTVYIRDDGEGMKERLVISSADGELVKGRKTVSVKADSATLAGFLAQTWLILPENDRSVLADQLKNIEILEIEYLTDDIKTKHSILEGEKA